MTLTEPLVLRPDVLIIPVPRLPDRIRRQIQADPSEFAVTLRHGRGGSRVVTAETARLLEGFRSPSRVVEVVLRYSREQGVPPDRLLADVFPVVSDCFNQRFLVPAASPDARRIEPLLASGARVAGCEIRRLVHLLEDTEVYQGLASSGRAVAVKLARSGSRVVREAFRREATVLRRLRGRGAPRVLRAANRQGRPCLVLEWCAGVPPTITPGGPSSPGERMRLLLAILRRYARLHGLGVLHGDVHPDNILVDRRGGATLLDFGQSALTRGRPPVAPGPRGGVAWYLDPEYAGALLRGEPDPPLTAAAEQYSLAALAYRLLTGDHYLEFGLERPVLLRQIVSDDPLPFARRGTEPWPAVEAVLERALAKDPGARYRSVAAFARALRAAAARPRPGGRVPRKEGAELEHAVRQTIDLLDPSAALFGGALEAPSCSVCYGSAGIAFALYRFASMRQSPALLAAADSWLTRAERESGHPGAWHNPAIDMGAGDVGPISLLNTPAGLHLVRAHLAQAVGDQEELTRAVERFLDASSTPCDRLDLFLGRAGTLLGIVLLLELLPEGATAAAASLRNAGTEASRFLRDHINALPVPGATGGFSTLGMAHGWAGLLYALLCWQRVSGTAPPAWLDPRLTATGGSGRAGGTGSGVGQCPAGGERGRGAGSGLVQGSRGVRASLAGVPS